MTATATASALPTVEQDAVELLAAVNRSHVEKLPIKRSKGSPISERSIEAQRRHYPILPKSSTKGNSRTEVQARLRVWGIDWDLDRVVRALRHLEPEHVVWGQCGIRCAREKAETA